MVEGEVLREQGDNFGFDAIGDVVEVVAVVNPELVGDAVAGQDFVELLRVEGDVGVTRDRLRRYRAPWPRPDSW